MTMMLLFVVKGGYAQSGYWQQKVQYMMDVTLDVSSNKLSGTQKITYFNNSPDKLNKVFFHLYWNAFRPNSMMDTRSRELGGKMVMGRPDWDPRVRDRILNLKPDEIGYQNILSLKMNGVPQKFIYHETILEVPLSADILPGSKVVFDLTFEAQVPLQVRRSGRDNPSTGVRYSMSQWYPKICEYDSRGWHPTPYVAREFYGVWGDFDVAIRLDKNYKLGATGVLSNAKEVGWGYDTAGTALKNISSPLRTWKFSARNIHDFVWAADPDYRHMVRRLSAAGPFIHVIYKPRAADANADSAWAVLADAAVKVLPFIEKNFGKYPYPQYSFILGGDGGMEYPMATLVAGPSLGTAFHEWMHSWYQMMLGTDEGAYPWMDEGFTDYAEDAVMKFYQNRSSIVDMRNSLQANPSNENLKRIIDMLPDDNAGAYASYFTLSKTEWEEPMTTHSDHYETNYGYSINAYSKGSVFLSQLGYIIGDSMLKKIMLAYYDRWKFRHPSPGDFIKTAQDLSGLQLGWYLEYWVATTKKIDYGIDSLWEEGGKTRIRIRRSGAIPMPIDLQCGFRDGSSEMHHVPLDLCFGSKKNENPGQAWFLHDEWRWTHSVYVVEINRRLSDLTRVEIDPSRRMADVDRKNNKLELNW